MINLWSELLTERITKNMGLKMKLLSYLLTILLINVSLSLGDSGDGNGKWNVFSKNIVKAIKSPNEGLRLSAMGMIIRYGDSLNVEDAVYDIMRLFRSHKDVRVRRLALVTLHKIQNKWVIYFLKRNQKFEKNEGILRQSCCIVYDYFARDVKQEKTLTQSILGSVE